MALTLTPLPDIPPIEPGNDLAEITQAGLAKGGIQLLDGDILVFAQKVISKAEGRLVNLAAVVPGLEAVRLSLQIEKDPRLVELILQESREILRIRSGTIIVEHRLGFICANAGIDHSNVKGEGNSNEEWVLLLPENPDVTAESLRCQLEARSSARLGVLIIDSHGRAWRMGTAGVAIGLSGLPGLVDLRGKKDLFGYTLQITQVGAADELASAASLLMGQADEGTPIIHVRGFPYELMDGCLKELLRPKEIDLFR